MAETVTRILLFDKAVFSALMPFAPCDGESSVQSSFEKLNTSGNLMPCMARLPFQLPSCAFTLAVANIKSATIKILIILQIYVIVAE